VTEFTLRTGALAGAATDTIVDFVFEDRPRLVGLGITGPGRALSDLLKRDGFNGAVGTLYPWHPAESPGPRRYLVAGLGHRRDYDLETLRRACSAVARALQKYPGVRLAAPVVAALKGKGDLGEVARAEVEGFILGGYRVSKYHTETAGKFRPLDHVDIFADRAARRSVETGIRLGRLAADATNFARDLVSEPAGHLTPSNLARLARQVARKAGLGCEVLSGTQLERHGMGGLIGVGRGSSEPSYLILLTWKPKRGKPQKKIALVGKGLTFDSGGLSLKTAEGMETMKADMSGAACVLAVMRALPQLMPPVEVIGVLAVAENMPGGSAIRPGDVLSMHSGLTVEVRNTDAEGRLVLADALSYVGRREPDEVIDLATLTGACVVALGPQGAGVMGNDQRLIGRILRAAGQSGEMMWPLPLYDDYMSQLASDVADIRNTGTRWGGAITAGLFLKKFVPKGQPWAHLDIAGPAFLDDDTWHTAKGATGAGVRTLLRLLSGRGR
jgi:leucyl aminopeptidase